MDSKSAGSEHILFGLMRVAGALRHGSYRGRENHGLSATQAQVLTLLHRRGPLRVKDLARELAVTSASASDSVTALERKDAVERIPDPGDRRARLVRLARPGRAMATRVTEDTSPLIAAIDRMPLPAREKLLEGLIELTQTLVDDRMMAPLRMCPACKFFRREQHIGAPQPHHCALMDVPLGPVDLRLDCPEHEPLAA
jgi:DNA-binding MarR family transcriptional regulator